MSAAGRRGAARAPAASATPPLVVWHELECGAYRADLPLWLELAEQNAGPILDVGAGTGRVSLALADRGHAVTALDVDPVLLAALSARDEARAVDTVRADARSFALPQRDFALCLVPMQTIQLLGGVAGRTAFLHRARAHLRPDGLLACAILSTLEPFDCSRGEPGPAAETTRIDELTYSSRPTRVAELASGVLIERERRVRRDPAPAAVARSGCLAADERPHERDLVELDLVELDRVSAGSLEAEARAALLRPERPRMVPATNDHVGSVVVMLRA